jgi:hypothetical protein
MRLKQLSQQTLRKLSPPSTGSTVDGASTAVFCKARTLLIEDPTFVVEFLTKAKQRHLELRYIVVPTKVGVNINFLPVVKVRILPAWYGM